MENNKAAYRLLTLEELNSLEKEFVLFLASQGIDSTQWQQLKQDSSPRVDNIVVQFSDFIHENALSKVSFLQRTDKDNVLCLHILTDKISIVQLHTKNDHIDFRQMDLFDRESYSNKNKLDIVLHEKPYSSTNRKFDIFQKIENGFKISDGKLYKLLCLIYAA